MARKVKTSVGFAICGSGLLVALSHLAMAYAG
jgi:hypothetical protein